MADTPFIYTGDDDARYRLDVMRDRRDEAYPHYDVDLVRTLTGRFGEDIEQRLTLDEYDTRDEAEAVRRALETTLIKDGLDGLGDAAERIQGEPVLYDGRYLFVTYPPDAEAGTRAAAHLLLLDADGGLRTERLALGALEAVEPVAAAAERDWLSGQLPFSLPDLPQEPLGELPFTRDDAGSIHDAGGQTWPSHVDGGGTAHWFAVIPTVEPASPYELRYFRALELGDGTFRYDAYPVMPLPDDDPGSAWSLPGLAMYLEKGDVYMAQQFAHDVADSYGQAFPDPHDLPALDPHPDYYFGYGIGPHERPALEAVKTWMDGSERRFDTFTVTEYDSWDDARGDVAVLEDVLAYQGVEAAMNGAERMAAAGGYLDPQRADPRVFFVDDGPPDPFTTLRERELAGPQYSVGAVSANGEHFLDLMKTWGADGYERLVIPQPTWEDAHMQAEMAFTLQAGGDLQEAMHLIEQAGVDAGVIDPVRSDPRLFTQGPPDPFQTLRELEIDDHLARYGVTWREVHEWQAEADHLREGSDTTPPRWQMATLPVSDPDGQPLGYALHMVVYPDGERDLNADDDLAADTPARVLEMAHFDTTAAVDRFTREFNGYLMPGLLEGPELAEEVARLEGLPAEWKILEGDDLKAYQQAELALTRDPTDWHPYDPNAERDARIEAEGLYTDPIHQAISRDEPQAASGTPELDF